MEFETGPFNGVSEKIKIHIMIQQTLYVYRTHNITTRFRKNVIFS